MENSSKLGYAHLAKRKSTISKHLFSSWQCIGYVQLSSSASTKTCHYMAHWANALLLLDFYRMFLLIIAQEQAQSLVGSYCQIDISTKILGQFECAHIVFRAISQPNSTYGDAWGSTARTSYTGGRDGVVYVQGFASTNNHLTGHFLTNRRLLFQHLMRNMKNVLFYLVGVRHDTTLKIVGRTRYRYDSLGNATARATLSCSERVSVIIKSRLNFATQNLCF